MTVQRELLSLIRCNPAFYHGLIDGRHQGPSALSHRSGHLVLFSTLRSLRPYALRLRDRIWGSVRDLGIGVEGFRSVSFFDIEIQ